jgi:hypothetical protein
VIRRVLKDLAISEGNIYNRNETSIILSMLGTVKVLVGKDDMQDYRDACVKRTLVTVVECISRNSRYIHSIII